MYTYNHEEDDPRHAQGQRSTNNQTLNHQNQVRKHSIQ